MLYRLPPPPSRPATRPASLPPASLPPRPAAGVAARAVAAPVPYRSAPPAPMPRPRSAPPRSTSPEDEVLWEIGDIEGHVLASRINRMQVRARIEAGLLENAALARKSGDPEWRPISDALGGSGARRISRYWYVTRKGGSVIGPVETTLVERGVIAGKVPLDSLVCEVGLDYWSPLSAVDAFREAIDEAQFDDEVTSSIDIGDGWSFTG